MKRLFLFAMALAVSCIYALADITCVGTVIDDEGEPVIGAVVTPQGQPNRGVPTDIDGNFKITVPDNCKRLHIEFVGMKPIDVPVAPNVGTVKMEIAANMLQDVVVTQSVARTRKTPVAATSVDAQTIDVKLGNQELPEVLKTVPGVWVTLEGGGFGDSKVYIRGFQPQNTATMVNGVPVNDMEWGGIYQSNWAGLGDILASTQVQRGLGAQIISQPSFGGTINYITKGLDAKKGGTAWYGLGNDNSMNYGLSFSTGMMKNGWAITFLGSRRTGDGYVQGTDFEMFNYFLNVSKRINEKNQISLTVTGAPQTHYQRSSGIDGLSIEQWQAVADFMPPGQGLQYNPTFGYYNGQKHNWKYNKYNKPVIMLNHIWQIDHKSSLTTVLYASIGTGGGTRQLGFNSTYANAWYGTSGGSLNWNSFEIDGVTYNLRNSDGTFNYDNVRAINETSDKGSLMALGLSKNSHHWFGGVTNYKNDLTEHLSLTAGLDIRYYYGMHTTEITDLYGGDYLIDYYRSVNYNHRYENDLVARQAYTTQQLHVGDIVYRNWDSRIWQEGIYGQLEYNMLDNNLNFVLSGAMNLNTYTRFENMYVDPEFRKSPTKTFFAGSVKGGVNYNIDRHNNVFVNGGYITRAPYLQSGVFVQSVNSNAINPNPKNEKVGAVEVGYEFHAPTFALQLNGYYTKWMDRTIVISNNPANDGDRYMATMNGANSRYMGVEMNFVYKPTKWVELTGMFWLADNIWQNNPVAYFYDESGSALSSINPMTTTEPFSPDHLFATIEEDGRKVGGSAQFTGALGAQFRPFSGLRIGAEWLMSALTYSNFSLIDNSYATINPGETLKVMDPWRVPWGQQLDLNASYSFNITGDVRAAFSANIYNVFSNRYIRTSYTNYSVKGSWENATGIFYAPGRTFSVRLKLYF